MNHGSDDAGAGKASRPTLAASPHFGGPLPFFRYVRAVRENTIATLPAEAFEEDILERRMLGRRLFSIQQPDALKHVLLDNADNYEKGPLLRQLLEPGLGKGLLTTAAPPYLRPRRPLAPVFHPH